MPANWMVLAAFLAVLSGCARHSASAPTNAYVDPAVCATCHAAIAKTYSETGMGRSFYRPGPLSFPSGGAYYHKPSDRHYEFSARGGGFFLSRHQVGFGGKEANLLEKSIDYVVGSGNHARTFLHRNPDGRLFELPVSWYSEGGGSLGMSPGYDQAGQEDFRRAVPDDCLFCHNAHPREGAIGEGIDCQRCHGPGSAHVAAASSGGAKPAQIRAAIVNPAHLDRDRQLDACLQCHLETTSLRLPNAIRNYNRAPFSYVPGEPLTDYEQFFDHAAGTGFDDRFEVAHQGYRLRKSACFQKSGMTCTTCHDPHQATRGPAAEEHYVSVCRGCHASAHTSGVPGAGSCLDCHMGKRRAEDAVHVVMTDHFIQRRKPARDLLAAIPEKAAPYAGEVIAYYPEHPPNSLYLDVAQVEHESNLQAGIARLADALARSKPDAPEFYVEMGKAESKAGKPDDAIHWFEEALKHRDNFHDALRELAATLATSGNWTRAIEIGERACAQQPPDTTALTNLANAYLRNGNPDRAQPILQRALAIDGDLPGAQNLLGLAWLAKQNAAAAEASFRAAITIQPDMAEAHNNLANLLAGVGNYPEAADHFQQALAADPGYMEAHRSYGLLLVLTRSFDQALAELKEAVRLAPDAAPVRVDYADILLEKGRAAEAGEQYAEAIRLSPGLAEAYYGLGNSLLARQRIGDAMRAFQSAIDRNADYYEAHLALGMAMAKAGNPAEAKRHFLKAAESADSAVRSAALKALR